ncbi:peroxisome biogenesis factor 1 [Dictyocaulus viviparus]|uniref:Peroxisomal ATPase PEX1 n=1 Tax=Dictyocaulus viviparus TaxID=29172 RepID=A0A0D8XHL1_DICVI|nr:peroxisome biogenesis factor 1 [Dictyocaulus viviparus]
MRKSSYPAFLVFHEFPNCFAYAWNTTSRGENTNISDRVSASNLIGYFHIRACESPENVILVPVFGSLPFTHIYVNRVLANLAKLKFNQEVILEQVNTSICTSVQILPLSADDYEILERSSNYVEEVLLQQIRIVETGMKFPLWVSPSIYAIFRIEHILPLQNQPSLVMPSTELHILMPDVLRNSPTKAENEIDKKIQINDVFPRIGTVSNYLYSPLTFSAEAFRVVPNSLVEENMSSSSLAHPCIIYILGDGIECSHYTTCGIMLAENFLNPSVQEFAHVVAVSPRMYCALVHLVPDDETAFSDRIRRGVCCFVAESGCTFTLKNEPLNNVPTLPLAPEPANYGFLSQDFCVELGVHSALIEELCEWAEFSWSNVGFGHALLLGYEGSGKTAIAACVARKLAFNHCAFSVRIDCNFWNGMGSESIEKNVVAELKKLSIYKPSLLILDDFDFMKISDGKEERNLKFEKIFHMLYRVLSVSTIPVLITAKQVGSLPKPIVTSVGKRLFAIRRNIPPLTQYS